jgi:hypothetical protein
MTDRQNLTDLNTEDESDDRLAESDGARWMYLSRHRAKLRHRIGDPDEEELFLINEITETMWEKRVSIRRARDAERRGDRRSALDYRKLFDRHRQALILLYRELRSLIWQRRKAQPTPSPGEALDRHLQMLREYRSEAV